MIDPTDLLVLLAVARSRTHVGAASTLGMNHTTVARRVKSLERQMGARLLVQGAGGWELTDAGRTALVAAEGVEAALRSMPGTESDDSLRGVVRISCTEVFGLAVVVPAFAEVRRRHPQIGLELVSVNRPSAPYATSVDLEIGVTKPILARLERRKLIDYGMGLFAAPSYLSEHGTPVSKQQLAHHLPIFYIESMLEVADLDVVDKLFGENAHVLAATSALAQLEMTKLGLGIGILPDFVAAQANNLQRLLPDDVDFLITYWMSGKAQNLRRAEVRVVAAAIEQKAHEIFTVPRPATPECWNPIRS